MRKGLLLVGGSCATASHLRDTSIICDGLLVRQNQRRWASYRVTGDSPQNALPDSPPYIEDSPQTGKDSPQPAPDSPQKSPDVPPHLAELLPLAAEARLRSRVSPATMRALIEALCRNRWLSASEIALLLARDAENLQSRFLSAMVREGRLVLRHPDVPNRPDQAYQTASGG